MKEYLTQKNLIISSIIIVLLVIGVAFKKRQALAPIVVDNSPLPEYPQGEVDNSSTPAEATPQEGNKEKLTYDQYLQQGINYETKGDFNSAIISYKNASKLAPKEYVPYSNAGSAYYSLKKYTEAEDHLLKALELSPNNVSVYTKLYDVYFYGLKRNPEQMAGFFEDAMKNTGNNINIVRLYASYLENIKDYQSALDIWQSLLKFELENASYKAKVDALQKKVSEIQ